MRRIMRTLILVSLLILLPQAPQNRCWNACDTDTDCERCERRPREIDAGEYLRQVEEKAAREGWIDEATEVD